MGRLSRWVKKHIFKKPAAAMDPVVPVSPTASMYIETHEEGAASEEEYSGSSSSSEGEETVADWLREAEEVSG
jgi:hypothetical protein